jgi:hypothetical protein
VAVVNYPGLESSPYYERAAALFANGCGGVLSFGGYLARPAPRHFFGAHCPSHRLALLLEHARLRCAQRLAPSLPLWSSLSAPLSVPFPPQSCTAA